MKKQETLDEKLEKMVDWLEEGHTFSEAELEEYANDPEARRIGKQLMHCKNAVAQHHAAHAPNPEAEWERFRQRKGMQPTASQPKNLALDTPKKSHRFLWGAITGMAASFLIVFLYSWYIGFPSPNKNTYMVFQATDHLQEVTLQTSTGAQLALSENTQKEKLDALSASLHCEDTVELSYSNHKPSSAPSKVEVEMHALSIPRGQNFKLVLADGTTVWMNAESRLVYPSHFTGDERVVQLSGEAYFQVAKDAKHPFIIQTEQMQARVLGTELNVRQYTANDAHITLINGAVEVSRESGADAICLKPGQDAAWTESGRFHIQTVDVDTYIYWKDGYFYFDNTPLAEVMQELGRWYNINVVFETKELMNLRIRYFCVRAESLERAVTLLNHMKKIKATISGNTIYIR